MRFTKTRSLAIALAVVGACSATLTYRTLVGAAEPAEATTGSRTISKLARAKLVAAREVYDGLLKQSRAGIGTIDEPLLWSSHLRDAELDAATSKQERVKALEAHVRRMKEYEDTRKAGFDSARTSQTDYAKAKFMRLDAELQLARAKAK